MDRFEVNKFLSRYLDNQRLINFYIEMQDCESCSLGGIDVNCLKETEFSGKLPGYGNPDSKIIFVAQQPSYFRKGFKILGTPTSKNRTDLYFKEGLEAAGFKRNKVFATNLIKCSSMDNEPMSDKVVEMCTRRCFLKELELLKPKYIVAVGRIAADFFGAIRNRFRDFKNYRVTTIRHPSYAVRGGMTLDEYKKEFIELRKLIKREKKIS